jgi:GxxExxY protein
LKYEELTKKILQACFEVSNELGSGFLESVYEKSLFMALESFGLRVKTQVPLKVWFRDKIVGDFYVDILVNDQVLVELKAVRKLGPEHIAQVLNYLKASKMEVGLLVNFGCPKLEYRRFNNYLRKI